ncbi:MAG: DNA polymerase III subunit [Lachnospiraceae bacterium]|jgi:DNA polymerase-3 subunit delta'|nr:DNA polymerase III subunit [Lachnospiraceae bacterium]
MPTFRDIIGQEKIVDHLQTAVTTGQVSHAYIITGERGMGKEFIARVFAMAVQCENRAGENPCGECHSCKQALAGSHPDIVFPIQEKPGVTSVDDIRRQIVADVALLPYKGPKKIYIIGKAEEMTPQAQNALLKTFEEPPSYAVIILLTANAEALLPTIRSRALLLYMQAVPDALVKKYLSDNMDITDDKADICVAFARGNIGKARLLATSEDFEKIKNEAISLLKNIGAMDISEIISAIRKVKEYKLEETDFLEFLAIWYRDVLVLKATRDLGQLIFKEEYHSIKRVADTYTYEGLEEIIESLEKAGQRLTANVNAELALELLLLTIKENE